MASFLGNSSPAADPDIGWQQFTPAWKAPHQAPLRHLLDQNLRQARDGAAHGKHDQRRVLFSAPPQGGTSGRAAEREFAPLKKTIFSLRDLREILLGCRIRRYLAHLSALDNFSAGVRWLEQLAKPREVEGRSVKGLNSFAQDERHCCTRSGIPKGNIAGFRPSDLLADLTMFSPTRLSRQLRRLRDIGVVKRVAGTYRYYLTKAGRAATAAAARLTEATIIPVLI